MFGRQERQVAPASGMGDSDPQKRRGTPEEEWYPGTSPWQPRLL